MKILFTNLLILFKIYTILGQQNLPMMFKNNPTRWSELNWVEGSKSNNQWFKNRLQPIVVDDTIYLFDNYRGLSETGISYEYNGFIIKKMNKITGQKYWELLKTYNSFDNRKAISQFQINENILNVTLYDEGNPGSGVSDWNECYPAHISIDINKGLVIDSNFVDYTDHTVPKFQSIAGSEGESVITNPRFYITQDGYVQREYSTGDLGFIETNIDFKGHFLSKDTTRTFFKYKPYDFRYFDNPDGTIGALLISKTFNWNDREMKYLKYDKSLNLIDSTDLSHHFTDTISQFNLYRADQGYIITVTAFVDIATRSEKYTYHLFDIDGNLVDILIYNFRDGIDNGIVYGWLFPMVDIVNKRLILTHSRQNKVSESTYFELIVSDRDSVDRIMRIEVDGNKDHFRTQYATMMSNGDILLNVAQFAKNNPASPNWFSWIMLDGQKMNIVSSTKDDIQPSDRLKLYPNPSSGLITIQNLEHPVNVKIYNLSGEIVKSLENVTNQVNVIDLPTGMYTMDIRNNQFSERHKIMKVE